MMSALMCKVMIFLTAFSLPLLQSSTQGIYLHRKMFQDNYYNVTPKDVGAFKFFCIHHHISSILHQFRYVFGVDVSDNKIIHEKYFTVNMSLHVEC